MHDPYIEALIRIHEGLPRKGPGADALSRAIADRIAPMLPDRPEIADLGCGNGHTALLLADRLGGRVTAVDFAEPFIDELRRTLDGHPLASRVTPRLGDMGDPPGVAEAGLDLIWSEGALFAIGVETGLAAWKRLLKPGGLLVFSEACWFTDRPSDAAAAFWAAAYPDIQTEAVTVARAERAGYRRLFTERLSHEAWWTSYFDPLRARLDRLEPEAASDSPLARAIADARAEQEMYRRHGTDYGYTFFVLRKA